MDEGLPLRKTSLTCIETILETCSYVIDTDVLLPKLINLLADKSELKIQCYQVFKYNIILY